MLRNYIELSPFDFECLIRDLLQSQLGTRMEVFPPGRDGGIDIRLLRGGMDIVVQCKHSPEKAFAQLRATFRSEAEAARSRGVAGEYWLATSATLTAQNKKELVTIFDGVNLAEERIIGRHDCDNLLNLHPEIERNHYKLYMGSGAVLERLISPHLFTRAEWLAADIATQARSYVRTPVHEQVRQIMDTTGSCVIAGAPGVGKTTIAQMAMFEAMRDGFELIVVSEDISEAEKLFKRDVKQVFFYDDFLGQDTVGARLNKNEDSRLVRFMRKLQGDPNHRLIMTTRDYILRRADEDYGRFDLAEIAPRLVLLDTASYDEQIRANIFLNHLYVAGFDATTLSKFVASRGYRGFLRHKHYNPRLLHMAIEIASKNREGDLESFLSEVLDNPERLWRDAFAQISEAGRDILITLASIDGPTELSSLRPAVKAIQMSLHASVSDPRQLNSALTQIEDTFISSIRDDRTGWRIFRLANGSVRDFLLNHIRGTAGTVDSIVAGSIYFEQLSELRHRVIPTVLNEAMGRAENKLPAQGIEALTTRRMIELLMAPSPLVRESLGRDGSSRFQSPLYMLSERLDALFVLIDSYGFLLPGDLLDAVALAARERLPCMEAFSEDDGDGYRMFLEYCVANNLTGRRSVKKFIGTYREWLEDSLYLPQSFQALARLYGLMGLDSARRMKKLRSGFIQTMPDYLEEILEVDYDYWDFDLLTDQIWEAVEELEVTETDWFKPALSRLEALPVFSDEEIVEMDRETEMDKSLDSIFSSLDPQQDPSGTQEPTQD